MCAQLIRACEISTAGRMLAATLGLSLLTVSCGRDSGTPPPLTSPTSLDNVSSVASGELIKGTAFDSAFRRLAGATIEIVQGTFFLNVAGNYVNISIGDHTDPGVAERIAPNTYYAFNGTAAVTAESPVSSISTPFHGWIERCALRSAVGDRYDCTPATALSVFRCEATHQLILTRSDQVRR